MKCIHSDTAPFPELCVRAHQLFELKLQPGARTARSLANSCTATNCSRGDQEFLLAHRLSISSTSCSAVAVMKNELVLSYKAGGSPKLGELSIFENGPESRPLRSRLLKRSLVIRLRPASGPLLNRLRVTIVSRDFNLTLWQPSGSNKRKRK